MSYTPSEDHVAPQSADHGAAVSHIEPDNIGVPGLIVLFALCGVVLVLVVVLLQAWFYNWKVDLLAERQGPIDQQQTPAAIAQLQRERIEVYGWVDPKTKKDRAIPINVAMELIVQDLAGPEREIGGK